MMELPDYNEDGTPNPKIGDGSYWKNRAEKAESMMETRLELAKWTAWRMQMALVEIYGIVTISTAPDDLKPTRAEWSALQVERIAEIAGKALGRTR